MSSKEIFIWTSDLAAYIGQNKWDIVTPFERMWKRVDKLGYEQAVTLVEQKIEHIGAQLKVLRDQEEKIAVDVENKLLTKRQGALALAKLEKEIQPLDTAHFKLQCTVDQAVLSKHDKLKKEFGDTVITALHDQSLSLDKKKEVLKLIVEGTNETLTGHTLTKQDKHEYVDDLVSLVNKQHGTENEMSAIEMFERQYECKLDTSQQFVKKCIFTKHVGDQTWKWYVCGKMDGIHHAERYVVEVKNRTKSFFSHVRDYENTQIQIYLHMLDFDRAKLVEKHKHKIRVTDIQRDNDYIEMVLAKLSVFSEAFTNFWKSPIDDKVAFLMCQDKETFLYKMFMEKVQRTMVTPTAPSAPKECLIDDLSDPLD
jgi:hypothetical protein